MRPLPPLTPKAIIDEIEELTGLPRASVEAKIRQEVLEPNSLIVQDARRLGVDFHVYNDKMENFYKQTDSFIFSLPVEFSTPARQEVLKQIKTRIEAYLIRQTEAGRSERIHLLMLGDGIGSDTLYLRAFLGDRVDFYYFDVPGSKTFDFAIKRFQKYNADVHILTEYDRIPQGFFDIVTSIEVLEHLPDPPRAIQQISGFLKVNGMALVTEFFSGVSPQYPSHLKSNLRYSGMTPFLFMAHGMVLTYCCKTFPLYFKPMEFVKKHHRSLSDFFRVFLDPFIFISLLKQQLSFLRRKILP